MPFVAVLDNTRIDATEVDEDIWRSIHRARPRVDLRCPSCYWRMHAKEGHIRYFAHDPHASDCASLGESREHQALKCAIAKAIRGEGWEARLEYDFGIRRTDVLALRPDESPVAFEIQLSPQTSRSTGERNEDLLKAGARPIWVVVDSAAIGRVDLPHLVVATHSDCPRIAGPIRERHEQSDPRREVRVPISGWRPLTRPHGIGLERTVAAVLAQRLTWSTREGAWLPSTQVAEHEAAQRRWERADRLARDQLELRQRAKQRWVGLRRSTAIDLRDRLVDLGHNPAVVKIFKGGSTVAHARSVRISGTKHHWLVHPAPNRISSTVRQKLAENNTIVSDRESILALRDAGVTARLLRDTELPEPDGLERTVTVAGRDVHVAVVDVLRRLQRTAAKSNLTATVPDWTEDGLLFVELSNAKELQRVGLWRGPDDSHPPTSSSDCDLLVVTRGRDAKRLSSSLDLRVVAGQLLRPTDLIARRELPTWRPPRHLVSAERASRPERDELLAAIDEFAAVSPPGTVWAHSPLDPDRPRAGRLVRCRGGATLIVCRDETLIPSHTDAVVLYVGDNAPPGALTDPKQAAEHLARKFD